MALILLLGKCLQLLWKIQVSMLVSVLIFPFSFSHDMIDGFHWHRYIFGKNSTMEKIPMTTPVFTQALDPELSEVSIQIVLPLEKDISR